MTMSEKITEAEAVGLAGVSARTLRRFQESGYLEVSQGSDGGTCYIRAQIVEIFGAAEALSSQAPQSPSEPQRQGSAGQAPRSPQATRPEQPEQSPSPELAISSAGPELDRLKNLVALQERILDLKDAEIADLRSQRDWLRSRVERLEEKSERDQILLLSETQTIRKLVSMHEGRKSALQNVLEWLGIAKQPELRQIAGPDAFSNSDTLEVKGTAANG
jgi:hypothetical protein